MRRPVTPATILVLIFAILAYYAAVIASLYNAR